MSERMLMIRVPLPLETAEEIYDVLVRVAGASADEGDRYQFTSYVAERASDGWCEYRFIGTLGFGGKFHINAGRAYVSCYPEHLTPEREKIIAEANAEIARILTDDAASVPSGKKQA